jgi:hypothetical protein
VGTDPPVVCHVMMCVCVCVYTYRGGGGNGANDLHEFVCVCDTQFGRGKRHGTKCDVLWRTHSVESRFIESRFYRERIL